MKNLALATATALILGTSAATYAATIPYVENFDDDTVGTTTPGEPAPESGTFALDTSSSNLAANPGASLWEVIAADAGDELSTSQQYRFDGTYTRGTGDGYFENSEANLQFNGLTAGNPFTIRYDFELEDFSVPGDDTGRTGLRVGFDLFDSGVNADSSGYQVLFEVAEVNTPGIVQGEIRITGLDNGGNENDDTVTVASDLKYTMVIEGSYADAGDPSSELTLSASLSDGTSTVGKTGTDSTPETGSYFGFRNRLGSVSSSYITTLNIHYDNLQVIPEPASFALLLLGGLAVLARRRRA
jgi:hypothetical protein